MPKTKGTKKVRIYFHHLLMTYSMNRNVVPQPSIDDCVNFFTRSLQYTLSSPCRIEKLILLQTNKLYGLTAVRSQKSCWMTGVQ